MVNPTGINAYLNQMKLAEEAKTAPPVSDSGSSFEGLMRDALGEAKQTLERSENLQIEALSSGRVDLADLVTAVSSAELTLNTVVAVRDRVISAYNDIVKMPI